jgi:RNA polymerase sigma-70 factor (ECF subfamily)
MADVLDAEIPSAVMGEPLDVVAIHRAHADFVWRTLLRLGVREADAPDLLQEVFVVVHQKRATYEPSRAKITSWLYGICLHLVRNHKRKAYVNRERLTDQVDLGADGADVERADARRALCRILDALDPDRRALIVMFEIEGLSCAEIASLLGVPIGTVYSRLSSARDELVGAALRIHARDGRAT